MTTYATTRAKQVKAPRDRIMVGGVDVTTFRGVHTPAPGYTLTEPLAYGSTQLSFPQVNAAYERLGVGELSWMKPMATVLIQRVYDDDTIVTDYRGVLLTPNRDGKALTWDVGGQVSGPAALRWKQPMVFRTVYDVGRYAWIACKEIRVPMDPYYGPVTGVEVEEQGDLSWLAWMQQVCALSLDETGQQWSLMPSVWGGSEAWEFAPKDYATVHFTLFNDDARVVARLQSPIEAAPTRLFIRGTTPDGEIVRNSKLPRIVQGPAPAYPMAGGAAFGLGTTDAGTATGSGVSTLHLALIQGWFIPATVPVTGTYTTAVRDAVKRAQKAAGLTQSGTVNVATWNALFDLDTTGYTSSGARIFPMAEDPRVEPWLYTSNGTYAQRNPAFDPSVPVVDETLVDLDGLTKPQMLALAQGRLARSQRTSNHVGTIELNLASGFAGEWAAGSSPADSDVMPIRDIRPGMNAWLPLYDGGTLVHIAGVDVRGDGSATLTVDTQARDLMEVGAILARDREASRNLRKEWSGANRTNKQAGAGITFDENGGRLFRDVRLEADKWNRIPIAMGQFGQVSRTIMRTTNDEAKFCAAVASREVSLGQMRRRIGNPFPVNSDGESAWDTGAGADWLEDGTLLIAWGDEDQPCGYWPRRHKSDSGHVTTAPITGVFRDDATWSYATLDAQPIVWLFVWPDRDCTLKAGRLFYKQEDDAR